MAKQRTQKTIEAIRHDDASRRNIPTAEYQPVMTETEQSPVQIAYQRRNRDLDPQLVWRGKDDQDWSNLVVPAPPLYIQDKVQPKVLIDDLMRRSHSNDIRHQLDLFADFNGLPSENARTEFYQHDQNWTNRMILGDSMQVMASLAEREGLQGQVQCIYLDPPYGIKFNSNFQWSTTSRDVQDGKVGHITREPEQVKAYRDTWRNGIHSYLTYLRDRFTVARCLLSDSGSIFVQIGDENVHRVRTVMDEVFGDSNFMGQIVFNKTTGFSGNFLSQIADSLLWYKKSQIDPKYRQLWRAKIQGEEGGTKYRRVDSIGALAGHAFEPTRLARSDQLTSQGASVFDQPIEIRGQIFPPKPSLHWKTNSDGLKRLIAAGRVIVEGRSPSYLRFLDDFPVFPINNVWMDVGGIQSRTDPKVYVVQTNTKVIERCILMTTDPGDLVLDPTCGSGTTAYVAEQWGRRWITVDTSRVALALARARIMGARYPYYLLSDSHEGKIKESEITHRVLRDSPARNSVRQGFVYHRVPHITLRSIANNTEIDVIWDNFQKVLEPMRRDLNRALGTDWQEWEIPGEIGKGWPEEAQQLHAQWRAKRSECQKEIDLSIANKAEHEYLYDEPYENKQKVRVAGPFTVESTSPHRVLVVDEQDELIDSISEPESDIDKHNDFAQVIMENLKTAGVQQAHKKDKIEFSSIIPWPGDRICAEGSYWEGDDENGTAQRAAIFVGPEFGTVSRPDLVAATREAGDGGFDVLISCAFNYDALSNDLEKLGRIPILKARMNADLHMAEDFKSTGKGNLFVIFGEPDIDIIEKDNGKISIRVNGVDVFHPNTGEVRSDGPEGIACWFIDTDYNEESFFVRHAYFLGAGNPYKALKTTLKTEIDSTAWASLHKDISRPFDKPKSGRVAVKVINHLGDEVMKVFQVN